MKRHRPLGAELSPDGVSFRIWAPKARTAHVVLDSEEIALTREGSGHFHGVAPSAKAGSRYRVRIDGADDPLPDPASRFQPEGPHGPSMVIDSQTYAWRDHAWHGVQLKGSVIYEMHIGTFTREGTWRAAIGQLARLAEMGITLLEVLPIAEFPGRFGWGYDGVDLWAPSHLYGTPDDFRAFVDAAHGCGLGVILDVVYNHFGPDGCYLRRFSDSYFTTKHVNDWGDSINFDGEGSEGVREFFSHNAAYWIEEFHLDGLRLDATQSVLDESEEHIIRVITRMSHEAAGSRNIVIVAENEPQDTILIDRDGVDALWNDDWHHSAMVAATGRNEAYYTDYLGKPQEFLSMIRSGFLYQGQYYSWQKDVRGTLSGHLPAERLICYLQNHDQVANSATGERLHERTSPGKFRALTALLLLGPNTPMLFQGEEFGASSPFLYFADHHGDLAQAVAKGRVVFLHQFPSIAALDPAGLAPPEAPATFERSRLDPSERDRHPAMVALHRDLLAMRKNDPAFSAQRADCIEGAVLGEYAFVLRFAPPGAPPRLLLINLGPTLQLAVAPEPLLALPRGKGWRLLWSSESPRYGGSGAREPEGEEGWQLPPECALVLEERETSIRRKQRRALDRR